MPGPQELPRLKDMKSLAELAQMEALIAGEEEAAIRRAFETTKEKWW